MSARKLTPALVALTVLALALGGVALASTPSTPVSTGGVTPYIVDNPGPGGNVACATLGYPYSSARTNYNNGSFSDPFPDGISVVVTGGTYVSWTSEFPIGAVIVKGGPAANIYEYSPASLGDSGLASPVNASGNPAGLSNLTFCWEGRQDPEYGRIIVDKVTEPAGSQQAFQFGPDWGEPFFLTDGQQPYDSGLLEPGGYSVTETLPEGWDATSAVCVVASGEPGAGEENFPVESAQVMTPDDITLGGGQTVVCTFTNTQRGRIVVDKVTVPGGSAQAFDFEPSWDETGFALADLDEPYQSAYLEPGTYSVAEVVPTGWSLASAVCSDQSDPAEINLAAGETVTCTFTNTQITRGFGVIVVDKVTVPGGSAQAFQFTSSWGGFSLTDPAAPATSGLLEPGTYSVGEVNLPAGWTLSSAVCSDGSSPQAIGLSEGETVTCTFTNSFEEVEGPRGSLTIVKEAAPEDGTPFSFAGSFGPFTLSDPAGPSRTFSELQAGTYTVTEVALPAGWQFDGAVCDAGEWSAQGSSVIVDLAEGEVATCVFSNSQEEVAGPEGSLTIVKQTNPAGGTGFSFDGGELGAFTLDDGGSVLFSELEPGLYTVTEVEPGGEWQFQSVQCQALDWSVEGRSVTVNLAEGEAAVCTFYNIAALPFTGSPGWLLPLLAAGLGALLLGGGALLALRRVG